MTSELLSTPSEDLPSTLVTIYGDLMSKYKYANLDNFTSLFSLMSKADMFKNENSQLLSKTPTKVIGSDGKERLQFHRMDGSMALEVETNNWSEGVRSLVEEHRERIKDRRDEMLKAFAQGNAAKFKGEINVSISDLNDLETNFKDIVSFSNEILSWLEKDPKTKAMRGDFEEALAMEIEDEKERAKIVDAVFGRGPAIMERTKEASMQHYIKVYSDEVLGRQG